MNIRKEQEQDRKQVFELNAVAFGREDEAMLVDLLRGVEGYISFVAEEDETIIGHIAFSPVTLNGERAQYTGLAPMSVLPEHQRTGIGAKLIKAGLDKCRDLGYSAVFVLGHVDYYPRFGFVTAATLGFRCAYPDSEEAFMVYKLEEGEFTEKDGLIEYDSVFSAI